MLQYRLGKLRQSSKLQLSQQNEWISKKIFLLRNLDNSYEEMESVCNLQAEINSLDTDVTDPVKTNLEPAGQTCLKESETICLKAIENQDASQPARLTGTMKWKVNS